MAKKKKVWKNEKIRNSAKFQGHYSCKNESLTPKRELELTLEYKAIFQVSIL
jgi:hypothetical protein